MTIDSCSLDVNSHWPTKEICAQSLNRSPINAQDNGNKYSRWVGGEKINFIRARIDSDDSSV